MINFNDKKSTNSTTTMNQFVCDQVVTHACVACVIGESPRTVFLGTHSKKIKIQLHLYSRPVPS